MNFNKEAKGLDSDDYTSVPDTLPIVKQLAELATSVYFGW